MRVKDNGRGIKEELKSKIFKMFGTVKQGSVQANTQGIGFGLAISKLLVREFDGQISFESREGQGTTFEFMFGVKPLIEIEVMEFQAE